MKRSSITKIIGAAQAELKRSIADLKAPRHPKPYYISYLIRHCEKKEVWARYGALCQSKSEAKRVCYVDVRVGNYRYDHTVKGGLEDNSEEAESFELIELPIENDTDALRFSLWRLTDARYREAVKNYHSRKSRDVSYLDSNKGLPSYTRLPKSKWIGQVRADQFELDKWGAYAKKASMVFKEYPEIKNSYVEITSSLVTKIFIDSEGSQCVWQEPVISMHAYVWFLTKKADLDITITHTVVTPDELPSLTSLKKELGARVAELYEKEKGDQMTSYTGPVLLGPRPAGLFIHEVLGHRLEGCRLLSDSEGRTFKDKLNQQIMNSGLTIYDDPTLQQFEGRGLVGSYPYDDEGSKATRADLVRDGCLVGFLTSRSPITKSPHTSNGHGRNQTFERPISRMANLVIEGKEGKSWLQLKEMLIAEVKRAKLPFGIILLEVEGGETGTEAYNFQAFMGEITSALKVFPDGREVYVRGIDFVGTPLSSLSQIIAYGNTQELDNGYCGAESGTIPVSTISPAMLLGSMELQAKDSTRVTQYLLPLPWHKKG